MFAPLRAAGGVGVGDLGGARGPVCRRTGGDVARNVCCWEVYHR
jgi:hypothetical protein